MSETKKMVTPSQYAIRCGVSRQAINQRITHGILPAEKKILPSGRVFYFIDINEYPPKRLRGGRRKQPKT